MVSGIQIERFFNLLKVSWNTISVQNVKNFKKKKVTNLSSNSINYMFSESLETTDSDFVIIEFWKKLTSYILTILTKFKMLISKK